jgi:uncharacterized protein DUF955
MGASKKTSDLGKWVLNRFGGADPASSIQAYAEELVRGINTKNPPVRVSLVARSLGIDPHPIYHPPSEQHEEGRLDVVDGGIRIHLRSRYGRPPHRNESGFQRMRFTYAHEVAHALFYDLLATPQRRIAPPARGREEEDLCNYAAGRFLVPQFLLSDYLATDTRITLERLRHVACVFQVSLFCLLIQAGDGLPAHIPPNKIYTVSRMSTGLRQTGGKEPRCIVCYTPTLLQEAGVDFLHTYQKIDKIAVIRDGELQPWSLSDFLKDTNRRPHGRSAVHREILVCPGGETMVAESIHTTLPKSSYVWTETTFELR